MASVSAMPTEAAALLAGAAAVGFDKCLYAVEVLHGETERPLEAIASGLTLQHMTDFLKRVPQDPLRRMLARGEIPVGSTPIAYENMGTHLSIARDRRLSVSDTDLLRWGLAQGVRTGINFRIRMPQCRYASVNFYSTAAHSERDLGSAMQALFLIGHQIHERLEPRLPGNPNILLSRREIECLDWIARGLGNREIAETLGLSIETVKEHVQGLFQKLEVNNRAHAVTRGYALSYLG